MPQPPDLLSDPQTLGISRALMKVGTGEPSNYSLSYLASSENWPEPKINRELLDAEAIKNLPEPKATKEFNTFTKAAKELVVALRQNMQTEPAAVTAELRQLIRANLERHLAQQTPLVTPLPPDSKYTKFVYEAGDIPNLTNALTDAIFAMAMSKVADLKNPPTRRPPMQFV